MRLFFALWPGVRTRALLTRAAAAVHVTDDARRVPPENYHLTLAFVGEVDDIGAIQRFGREFRGEACTFVLDRLEHWAQPQLLVATVRAIPPALMELTARLHCDAALRAARVPWRAHVTIARKVAQAPVLQAMSAIRWRAFSFSLVRSDTGSVRSVYTVVGRWPLLYEARNPTKSP